MRTEATPTMVYLCCVECTFLPHFGVGTPGNGAYAPEIQTWPRSSYSAPMFNCSQTNKQIQSKISTSLCYATLKETKATSLYYHYYCHNKSLFILPPLLELFPEDLPRVNFALLEHNSYKRIVFVYQNQKTYWVI